MPRLGRRPGGNIRKLPTGGYRLRFRRHGVFRTSPEVYGTRAEAEQALWGRMADDGRATATMTGAATLALVLLATFAMLAGAGRSDRTAALRYRPAGAHGAGPGTGGAVYGRNTRRSSPLSGRRVVGIPQVIIPVLREHLSIYVKDEPGALAFPGAQATAEAASEEDRCGERRSIGAEGLAFSRSSAYGEHVRGKARSPDRMTIPQGVRTAP